MTNSFLCSPPSTAWYVLVGIMAFALLISLGSMVHVHKVKKREHDIIAADHAQELQDEHDDHKWKMTKLDPQGQGMAKMNENYRTGYENKEYGFSSLGKKQREERRESGNSRVGDSLG